MKLVIASDPSGGIGYQNKLPWNKIQGDLSRFKQLTESQEVVMGRQTWESLPIKPLPNRKNYVLSKNLTAPGAIVLNSELELKNIPNAWIIGGSKTIEACWDMITEVHLTRTYAKYTCDTFFNIVKLENEFKNFFKIKYEDHTYELWRR